MNQWMITCLLTANISLNNEMRDTLITVATSLIQNGTDKVFFRIKSAEGVVRKERDHISFMGDGGPLFFAEIETTLGKGKVRFILPDRYLYLLNNGARFGDSVWVDDNPAQSASSAWN